MGLRAKTYTASFVGGKLPGTSLSHYPYAGACTCIIPMQVRVLMLLVFCCTQLAYLSFVFIQLVICVILWIILIMYVAWHLFSDSCHVTAAHKLYYYYYYYYYCCCCCYICNTVNETVQKLWKVVLKTGMKKQHEFLVHLLSRHHTQWCIFLPSISVANSTLLASIGCKSQYQK